MNKKGFTLVEVLIVIALIGLLFGIGVPGVMKISKNMKERSYKTKVNLIEQAAVLWGQDNKTRLQASNDCEIDGKTYSCYKIAIGDLIEEDFLDSDKDYESEDFKNSCVYVYKKNNRVYSCYTEDPNCNNEGGELTESNGEIVLKNNTETYNQIRLKSVASFLSSINRYRRNGVKTLSLQDFRDAIQEGIPVLDDAYKVKIEDVYVLKNGSSAVTRFSEYKSKDWLELRDSNGAVVNIEDIENPWKIEVDWDSNERKWIYTYSLNDNSLKATYGELEAQREVKLVDDEAPIIMSVLNHKFYSSESDKIKYVYDEKKGNIYESDYIIDNTLWYIFDNYDGDKYYIKEERPYGYKYIEKTIYDLLPTTGGTSTVLSLTDTNGNTDAQTLSLLNVTAFSIIKYIGRDTYYTDEVIEEFTDKLNDKFEINTSLCGTASNLGVQFIQMNEEGTEIKKTANVNTVYPSDWILDVLVSCNKNMGEGLSHIASARFPVKIRIRPVTVTENIYSYGGYFVGDTCYPVKDTNCKGDQCIIEQMMYNSYYYNQPGTPQEYKDSYHNMNVWLASHLTNPATYNPGTGTWNYSNGNTLYPNHYYNGTWNAYSGGYNDPSLYDSNGCFMGHC